jgi:hypothetical protein
MALIAINFKPSKKDLAVFGFGGCLILWAAALVVLWRGHSTTACVLLGIGLVLALSRLLSLKLTKGLYLAFVVVTLPIGWTIGHALMFLFFYGLLMPVGLFFRLIGRDALHCRLDPQAPSYWTAHKPAQGKKRYFQQF